MFWVNILLTNFSLPKEFIISKAFACDELMSIKRGGWLDGLMETPGIVSGQQQGTDTLPKFEQTVA